MFLLEKHAEKQQSTSSSYILIPYMILLILLVWKRNGGQLRQFICWWDRKYLLTSCRLFAVGINIETFICMPKIIRRDKIDITRKPLNSIWWSKFTLLIYNLYHLISNIMLCIKLSILPWFRITVRRTNFQYSSLFSNLVFCCPSSVWFRIKHEKRENIYI